MVEKIILVKYMLNVIPNYLMIVLKISKDIILDIYKQLRLFMWEDNIHRKRKITLISWGKVSTSKFLKGASVQNLEAKNISLVQN